MRTNLFRIVGTLGLIVGLLVAFEQRASAEIKVTKARIGCLDIQKDGNLTAQVARSCNGKDTCSYKAPTPDQYRALGVQAATRTFCTQAMEITYNCGTSEGHTVTVPGDAWKHPPAQLSCAAAAAPPPTASKPDVVNVRAARIGCLDIQTTPNLTAMVAGACNGKATCAFKAPTEAQYKAAGVTAATRTFCTQAMEITYDCGRDDPRTAFVAGDAWNHPPALLACGAVPPPAKFEAGEAPIKITAARIGCLDEQKTPNLTQLVGKACNGRARCSYPAPTPDAYTKAGVKAATRPMCSQAMEIKYRCGASDDHTLTVPGDAWKHPPARIVCDGKTVATNRFDVTPAQGRPAEPPCKPTRLGPPGYYLAPKEMLDWTPTPKSEIETLIKHFIYHPDLFQALSGFVLPKQPTPDQFSTQQGALLKAPSVLGANEGRVRDELRKLAARKDPLVALCQAAQRFTSNKPAAKDTPSDDAFGLAFADLAVTGKVAFAAFARERPDEAKLKAHAECRGASDAAIAKALDRAYAVATALRKPHDSIERKRLGWIAVSGEDDKPYRPVNVPSTRHPQFDVRVSVPKFAKVPAVNSRYMIAHKRPPRLAPPAAPLVDGGKRKVPADPAPAIAADAEVIIFIHGMDSRVEEADHLTDALHKLPGTKNWTVISLDLPTSGYADSIPHTAISAVTDVTCHRTPLVDYIEEFIVAFVDEVDRQTKGQLKPRIKAVVGGSLGGNMSLRLGRRADTPWVRNVVPWSPASIWPSMIAQRTKVAAGCDTGWDLIKDRAVDMGLTWSGKDPFFLPDNELQISRRALFYGAFDWAPVFGITGQPPQAQCWLSDKYRCKNEALAAARLDRHETYDRNFRAWHWRLGAEQLAFSHQLFAEGTKSPLYLRNHKRTLLMCGYDDTCGQLCEYTRDVASKMVNTPGYARFLKQTGHAMDGEYPHFVAREIAKFLE